MAIYPNDGHERMASAALSSDIWYRAWEPTGSRTLDPQSSSQVVESAVRMLRCRFCSQEHSAHDSFEFRDQILLAVTMLKAAGVSDFIAREIVGHESAAVSRQYTHLTTDDKRTAMQRLPDVTRHE